MDRKSNWFASSFLPSLFEKRDSSGQSFLWLSEKQLEVCERYMDVVQTRFDGRFSSHLSTIWNGREVKVYIVPCKGKKLGQMYFTMTEEEKEHHTLTQREKERERELFHISRSLDRLRMKGLDCKIATIKKELEEFIEDCKEDILYFSECIENGENVKFSSEELAATEDDLSFALRKLELFT